MDKIFRDKFPDGTYLDNWFYHVYLPSIDEYERKYIITDYGIKDDGKIYTKEFQNLIDLVNQDGGGLIIVPEGVYLSGALFFKQGVHLYIEKDGVLKGSDVIKDFPPYETRIEGETCIYHPALINADNVDGFIIFGEGIIDGNGLKHWEAFWQRKKENPNCTNKEVLRNRLVYLSNSYNCGFYGVSLRNSPFWTTHIYKCEHIKFISVNFYSPKEPVPAPSTDGIDIDACHDVLIEDCYFEVNDDAIALKGGKGPYADKDENNGMNERIVIRDCSFGFCHSVLTCGSESIHNKNILVKRIKINDTLQLLHLKMRPDTPQHYEYIEIDAVEGNILQSFINLNPWTQFFDLKGREDMPISKVNDIAFRNCECKCGIFFNVSKSENYMLSRLNLINLDIITNDKCSDYHLFDDVTIMNVDVKEI